jgi:uncharacterized DUF497 family protein
VFDFSTIEGFDWDEGNLDKNWIKHQVSNAECEELFFNLPLVISDDVKHFQDEKRYYALGKTDTNRLLFIAFTIRKDNIRVISARDMNQNERTIYAQANS